MREELWSLNTVLRVRHICNFFYSLRSESKQIWILFVSYRYICIHNLFASFAYTCFKIFAQIYIQIFDLMQNEYIICSEVNICLTFFHTGKYSHQNIRFEEILRKISLSSEFLLEAFQFPC